MLLFFQITRLPACIFVDVPDKKIILIVCFTSTSPSPESNNTIKIANFAVSLW